MTTSEVGCEFISSSIPFLKTRDHETVIRTYNTTNNYNRYRIYHVSCFSCFKVIPSDHISKLLPRCHFRSTFPQILVVEHATLIQLGRQEHRTSVVSSPTRGPMTRFLGCLVVVTLISLALPSPSSFLLSLQAPWTDFAHSPRRNATQGSAIKSR